MVFWNYERIGEAVKERRCRAISSIVLNVSIFNFWWNWRGTSHLSLYSVFNIALFCMALNPPSPSSCLSLSYHNPVIRNEVHLICSRQRLNIGHCGQVTYMLTKYLQLDYVHFGFQADLLGDYWSCICWYSLPFSLTFTT